MANKRMYLVHVPSGLGVYLGKRMGSGWYGTPNDLGQRVTRLFDEAEIGMDGLDNYSLFMENGMKHTTNIQSWWFGENRDDGLLVFRGYEGCEYVSEEN